MVNGAMQLGVAVGPSIVGILRDRWNGYEGPLYVLAGVDALAMAVILSGRILRSSTVQDEESRSTT
jgi:cyanate permease